MGSPSIDVEIEASQKLRRVGRAQRLGRTGHRAAPGDGLCCVCRRFGTKCAGCAQGISPSDLVRKARSKVFHLNCFTCMVCNKQLSTGEELYVIDENKFVCKDDYLSSSSLKEGSLNSGRRLHSSAAPGASALAPCAAWPLAALPPVRLLRPILLPLPLLLTHKAVLGPGKGQGSGEGAQHSFGVSPTGHRNTLPSSNSRICSKVATSPIWNCAILLFASSELLEISTCAGRTLSGFQRKERREKI